MLRIAVCVIGFLLFTLPSLGQSYVKKDNGIELTVDGVNLRLTFYSPEILRIVKYPDNASFEPNPFTVVMKPGTVRYTVTEQGDDLLLKSDSITAAVNKVTGRIIFTNSRGKVLLREKDYGIQFTPVTYAGEHTYLVRQAFRLDPDEHIYGLGQHQTGKMNQRNQMLYLRQSNMEICIPYWQSQKGYSVYWDNMSPTTFTDNQNETAFDSQVGEGADYYFMYGSRPEQLVRHMRQLTGSAPMNALWTYGYWQSRSRYESQEQLLNVVRKYRQLQVPLDCIVQDWLYWGTADSLWNATNFDATHYPDPSKMLDDVHQLHAHMAVSVWPSFGKGTEIHRVLKRQNMLLKFSTWPDYADVYDPFHPEARQIYWNYLNKNIFSKGMDCWWLDATEPEFTGKDRNMDVPCHLGLYRRYCNAFPIATVGGVYQNQRKTDEHKRVTILTRSAFAGQQRYGAYCWSGDVQSTWESLRCQIPAGLNYAVCGLPYWNTDIGGFVTGNSYPDGLQDLRFHELYVRWLQFGAFSPLMRSHCASTPREIYQFGHRGSWAYDAIEKSIRLRYKLLPYIYAVSWGVSHQNDMFMRPLFMTYPNDAKVYDLGDEYLFGPSLLVAPVTEPMYASDKQKVDFSITKSRELYLPEGNPWYDFWTGERLAGGRTVNREAPIDIIPLYVKAGTILPMGPDVQYATEKPWDALELRIYKGADADFTLYEDEGDNYNYEHGSYATISFHWDDKAHTLTIGNRTGSYPGMLKERKFRLVLVGNQHGVGESLTAHADRIVNYKGKKVKLKL